MAESHLDAVYSASNPDELTATYDSWAATYEADMARVGYRHPAVCLSLLARHLPRGAAPVLDAAAGTGLLGEWLGILGYPEVDALDASLAMLDVARSKHVYRQLQPARLGEELPFDDGRYAGVVCSGVFTTGHVGVEALPELLRVVRSTGVIVLTVKQTLWDDAFGRRLEELSASGRLDVRETTSRYASMPGRADPSPSLGVVLQVN